MIWLCIEVKGPTQAEGLVSRTSANHLRLSLILSRAFMGYEATSSAAYLITAAANSRGSIGL